MAQLKDSLITGDLRVTGTTYTNELDAQTIKVPTTSGGSTIGAGSSGQVVMSNGTSSYWGSVPAGTAVKGNAESTYRTGNVNLTPANLGISATASSVTVGSTTFSLPSTMTPSSHTHGKITNAGAIASTDNVTIGNNDRLVISDSSDSSVLKNTSIVFDGSTATKALTQKGTWETFNNYSHPSGDGNLHVPATSTTHNNYFLKAGSTAGSLSWVQPVKYGYEVPETAGDFVGQVFIKIVTVS